MGNQKKEAIINSPHFIDINEQDGFFPVNYQVIKNDIVHNNKPIYSHLF